MPTFYDPSPLHLYFYISVSHIWCDCCKAKIPAYCILLLVAKNALIFVLFTYINAISVRWMGVMFISTEGGSSSKNPLCNLTPSPLELIQTISRTWDHVSALSLDYGGLRLTGAPPAAQNRMEIWSRCSDRNRNAVESSCRSHGV